MQAQLVRNGIVAAPTTGDLAAAVQPYMRSAPTAMTVTASAGSSLRRIAKRLETSPEVAEEGTLR